MKGLDPNNRSEAITYRINNSYLDIRNESSYNIWKFTGGKAYGQLPNLEHEVDLFIQYVNDTQKKEYFILDYGAGDCKWGINFLKLIKNNIDIEDPSKIFHIISLTGDRLSEYSINRKDKTLEKIYCPSFSKIKEYLTLNEENLGCEIKNFGNKIEEKISKARIKAIDIDISKSKQEIIFSEFPLKIFEIDNCKLYLGYSCPIEKIHEFAYDIIGCNKLDYVISNKTFRHLTDPVGSLNTLLNLLDQKAMLMLDNFYLASQDFKYIENISESLKIVAKTLSDQGNEVLIYSIPEHIRTPHDKATMIIRKMSNNCYLEFDYAKNKEILDLRYYKCRIDSNTSEFAKLEGISSIQNKAFSTKVFVPAFSQEGMYFGDKNLYEYITKAGNKMQQDNEGNSYFIGFREFIKEAITPIYGYGKQYIHDMNMEFHPLLGDHFNSII